MTKKPKKLIVYARKMRKESTPAEQKLWKYLRRKQFACLKFRRQYPIPPYIVDFFCAARRLVIELDGESHIGKEYYDQKRQQFLAHQGLMVLRFWDTEIYDNLQYVLDIIEHYCFTLPPPPPPSFR